ncbi:hypothetical protein [Paenibacillus sp. MMS20-IR301]|uniref:hypothetical protein n=1 Tax=Paenibacillus sp. MMS20-IR301 TaxID=2895946 RepID=UPI0028F08C23|nr:hypothetical protein [Paenibacillus sp. MMS20-IR301]WNS44885.1 hypothetical protein LOS79_06330 [Paenibacillus sp. MMS20-IR301]
MADRENNQTAYKERQQEIIRKAALEAERLPLLDSGLWFHDDVRNNFYYASYLFAAAVDETLELPIAREEAKRKAEAVLLETVLLQNRQPGTELYGHWPLGLNPVPREAGYHELPVEIMGSLMAWFCKQYSGRFSAALRIAFHTAIGHVYRSGFFRKPVTTFGHHEAKYTAAKLIFGRLFADDELLEDGRHSLELTLAHIRERGMPEYGSLPWFWHWVQAFTCAWELEEDDSIKHTLSEMLDYLWNERSQWYLQGAWAGAHSRGWPHDVPADGNVLHDYVQFGDFRLSEGMPRTEYAGFLCYAVPEQVRTAALDRRTPAEVCRQTEKVVAGAADRQAPLHSYAYITADYAAGGMWERVEEFDNEQLRWAYSLPVGAAEGVNRLYFFHPGQGYYPGDPRHQSEHMEVLYHKNTVIALFPVPAGTENTIVGVLPKGEWVKQPSALFGFAGSVYFAVYLSHAYELEERQSYLEVTSADMPGGVVVEALSTGQAAELGIKGLRQFAEAAAQHAPEFTAGDKLSVQYTSRLSGTLLQLSSGEHPQALISGSPVSFDHYTV